MTEDYRCGLKFGDLLPGTLARIPYASPSPDRVPVLPPAVRILATPIPCSDTTCSALVVMAREVDSGHPHLYHRLPHRGVIHITPAQEATP